jgi:flagellar biosynthesis regulator FlaF
LTAAGRDQPDAARLEALFTAERDEEWAEFLADCAKFDAEIDKEIRIAKFTMAELEEEEHSLERLRRWHRELAARDVFGAPTAAEADQNLKHCTERLADYTERVFTALHQM